MFLFLLLLLSTNNVHVAAMHHICCCGFGDSYATFVIFEDTHATLTFLLQKHLKEKQMHRTYS